MWVLIWKNVAGRRVRSGLTIVGLAVAIGAVVSLVGVSRAFRNSLLELLRGHQADLNVSRANMTDRNGSSLKEGLDEVIRKVPGVTAVEPTLSERLNLNGGEAYGVLTQGFRPNAVLLGDFALAQGRRFKPGEARVAVIGEGLAKGFSKGLGDTFEFYAGEPFEIIGIFKADNVMDSHSVVISLADMQKITDRPGQVTSFLVTVDKQIDGEGLKRICKDIAALGLGLSAQPAREFVLSDPKLRLAGGMAWATSFIALLIGAIGMLNTMSVSVFERTREIGVLRAIGWRRNRIVGMVISEAMLLSLAGATVGTLGGLAFLWLLLQFPTAKGMIALRLDLPLVAIGYAIALGVGLFAAAYPAWLAARLPPTEALRHD